MTKKTTMNAKTNEPTTLISAYVDRGFIHSHTFDEYPDNSSYSAYVSSVKTNTEYVACNLALNSSGAGVSIDFDSYGDDDGHRAIQAAEDFLYAVTSMVEALKKAVNARNVARKVKE